MTAQARSLADRLKARLDTSGGPSACWPARGYVERSGHTKMWRDGRMVQVHRVAYELAHGPIPAGKHVLHSCDNAVCCNPRHMRLGTNDDNVRDRVLRRRSAVKLTPTQVAAIRADARTQTVVAAEHGVHQSQISRIKAGLAQAAV